VIRVAAVGDVHAGLDSAGTLRPHFEHVADRADVLLLAGDLTRHGDPAEATVLVDELRDLGVPTIAVLGNHDHHCDAAGEITAQLEQAGIRTLEGEATVVPVDGTTLGVAGSKGFGGGFAGACATDFGEPEMKAFIHHTQHLAARLHDALASVEADVRVALLHYSPVEETLRGERLEIYPFLGSYLLAEAVDSAGADLVVHGHAHAGSEKGMTPGGIHVRNVAQPVIKHAYHVYCLGGGHGPACD
jgi:Icc-related predicted phosphoesterase